MVNQLLFYALLIGFSLSLLSLPISAQNSNELADLADSQFSYSKDQFKAGNFEKAFNLIHNLDQKIAEKYPDSLMKRGFIWKEFGDLLYDSLWKAPELPDSSIKYYERAIPFFKQAQSIDLLAQCYLGISVTYIKINDLRSAEKSLLEVEKIKNQLPQDAISIYMQSQSILGYVYWEIGDYDQAFEYSMKVLEEESKLPTTTSADSAFNLNNVGVLFSTLGDYEKGSEYKLRALEIYNRTSLFSSDDLGTIYSNIGFDQLKLNQSKQAITTFQKALFYADKLRNKARKEELFISIYNELANVYIQKSELDSARVFLEEALKYGNELENAGTTNNLGYIYKIKGDQNLAIKYLKKGFLLYQEKKGRKHPDLARPLVLLGQIYLSQGNAKDALAEFQKALNLLSDDNGSPDWQVNPTLSRISDRSYLLYVLQEKIRALRALAKEQKNFDLALETSTLAISLIDSLALAFKSNSALILLNERARAVYELGIATSLDLYERTNDENLLKTAFVWSEKSKSALLTSSLRQNDALQFAGIPDTLQAYEIRLKRQRTFYQTQIITEERKGDNLNQSKITLWRNKLFKFNREYEALKKDIEKRYPDYYQLSYDLSVASVDDIQENLKEDQVLIEYFVGDEEWFVFGIGKEGTLVERGEKGNLNQKIDDFSNLLSSEESDLESYQTLAFQLYQTLLQPINKLTLDKELIFIPDGLLNKISFEALLVEEAKNNSWTNLPYLIKAHETSYGYSATLWLQSKGWRKQVKLRRRVPRNNQFLGYAPFRHLPNASSEIVKINEIFRGKVRAWPSPEANKETFLLEAPNFGILHLATHTVIDNEEPLNSRLIFSPAAISSQDFVNEEDLYAWELYNLRLKAQMVVLSACNTGTGKLEKAEGVISLGRAFVYAGVPSIVMSLWLAESKSTADIMTDFYQNLNLDKPKSVALREAKLKHLDSDRFDTHHPYFWATFVVLGDAEALSNEGELLNGLLLVLLIVLICGGVAWKFFRTRSQKA